jgi:FAD/FMN-containing dehydrogenase
MGAFGLAADNLVSAEVVTAGGAVVTASEEDDAELLWALRGGGGNFGVVTWFEYRLHPVGPIVTGGMVVHPFEAARDVLRFYREFTTGIPDELCVFAGLIHAPDGSGAPLCGLVCCHVGSEEQAAADLAPLLAFGSPVDVQIGPMPYSAVNAMIDDAFPKGVLNYWKSSFLADLSDDAIDTLVERFSTCPSPMSLLVLEHFHGEVTRVPVGATAVPHREESYNLVLPSVWMDPAVTEENVAWAHETFAAFQPFLADRRYVNYLDGDEPDAAVRAAYGANYERLARLKAIYDPENLFRLNQNIPPAP